MSRGDAVAGLVFELNACGARAVGAACDVRSETEVVAAVRKDADRLGGLDTVVASAGIARAGRALEGVALGIGDGYPRESDLRVADAEAPARAPCVAGAVQSAGSAKRYHLTLT